jgi:cytochrome P450
VRERLLEAAAVGAARAVDARSRGAFGLLRRARPVLVGRGVAVVSRRADVLAVLADHEGFGVPYARAIEAITGPFLLGVDDAAAHARDRAALREVMPPEDAAALGERTVAAVERAVAARHPPAGAPLRHPPAGAPLRHPPAGAPRAPLPAAPLRHPPAAAPRAPLLAASRRVDAIGQVIDPVLGEVVGAHLGVPGPDRATQLRWARAVFAEIFLNPGRVPSVRRRARAAAVELCAHVDELVAARQATLDGGASHDVLGRLLLRRRDGASPFLDDAAIRHNLIGLLVAWLPTASKAAALALDELLRRPEALRDAVAAARAGDRARVGALAWEALRFRPHNAVLVRRCRVERTVAGTRIPRRTTVVVGLQSAMWDPRAVPDPARFRADRPWETYLHLGHGLHRCLGEPIIRVQLPALLTPLLAAGVTGRTGRLRWSGPFPSRLEVSLEG